MKPARLSPQLGSICGGKQSQRQQLWQTEFILRDREEQKEAGWSYEDEDDEGGKDGDRWSYGDMVTEG